MTLLRVAVRSITRNKRRAALTLAAVVIGVAAVIFAFGFGDGVARVLVASAIETRLGALQVHRRGYLDASEALPLSYEVPTDAAFLARIEAVAHVTAAAPRVRFGGILGNGATSTLVMVEAIDDARELRVCPARASEVPSELGAFIDAENAPRGGVLGAELLKALSSKRGETLVLQAAGRHGAVNALDLEVRGVTRGATSFLEAKRVLIVPLAYAQELLRFDGHATEIAVSVDDLAHAADVQRDLRLALGPEYTVSTWDEVTPFLRDVTVRLSVILRGVSAVLFFIVVFGVVNTMLMNVYERVREIGTMMAVGVRRRQILQLFLLESAALGVLGGVAGAALGLAATFWLSRAGIPLTPPGAAFEQVVRPVVHLDIAALAVLAATVGGMAAAAYPAHKASRLNPVDALRAL